MGVGHLSPLFEIITAIFAGGHGPFYRLLLIERLNKNTCIVQNNPFLLKIDNFKILPFEDV